MYAKYILCYYYNTTLSLVLSFLKLNTDKFMDASFIKQDDLLCIAPGIEGKAMWINTVNGTYYTNNSIGLNSDPSNPGLIGVFYKA